MRWTCLLVLSFLLAGCADGSSAQDRARNDHDLGVLDAAGLALQSQVRTDANDVGDVLRRAGAPSP